MTPAHLTRLITFAQHGQPTGYAASDMMREDLRLLVETGTSPGDLRALKYVIHSLESDVMGFMKIAEANDAEIERLKAERDDLKLQLDASGIEDIRNEIVFLKANAERYQWLRMRICVEKLEALSGSVRDAIAVRTGCSFLDSRPSAYSEDKAKRLDSAIDAAKEKP